MSILSRGIDISRWQGNFDMSKAKAEGVNFAIIKGGGGDDGLYKDSQFEANYVKAKAQSLHVGAYWFSRALTVTEAVTEANYFYDNVLKGKQFDLPVYIDVENKTQLNVGKRLLTDIIKAWCDTLEKRGYWVGIYSSLSYFNTYIYDNELTRYAHWVAQWAKECTYSNTSCLGMWQYGGETNLICSNIVAGVVCDQNYMLVDYPTLIKGAGLNGYNKMTAALKPIDEIAREVIRGEWGNGTDRINRLTAAGYDSGAVQTRVNELCSAPSQKSIDEVAREVIRGEWGNGTDRVNRLTVAGYDSRAVQARVNELLK